MTKKDFQKIYMNMILQDRYRLEQDLKYTKQNEYNTDILINIDRDNTSENPDGYVDRTFILGKISNFVFMYDRQESWNYIENEDEDEDNDDQMIEIMIQFVIKDMKDKTHTHRNIYKFTIHYERILKSKLDKDTHLEIKDLDYKNDIQNKLLEIRDEVYDTIINFLRYKKCKICNDNMIPKNSEENECFTCKTTRLTTEYCFCLDTEKRDVILKLKCCGKQIHYDCHHKLKTEKVIKDSVKEHKGLKINGDWDFARKCPFCRQYCNKIKRISLYDDVKFID